MHFTVDIELTNRCNAKCHFCPRDQTPHEGLMSRAVFDRSLARAVEFRDLECDDARLARGDVVSPVGAAAVEGARTVDSCAIRLRTDGPTGGVRVAN